MQKIKNRIKDWWSIYKEDLGFNVMMTIMCGILYILTIVLGIWAIIDIIEKF